MSLVVEEIIIPESVEAADRDTFQPIIDIRNAMFRDHLGEAADPTALDELLVGIIDQTYQRLRLFAVLLDGSIVAYGFLVWSTEPDTRVTWLDPAFHPDHHYSPEIAAALYDHLESIARASSRPILQLGELHHTNVPGPRLESPTGFGSLPREEKGVRFFLDRGYSLEQIIRMSSLRLPVSPATLEAQLATAQERAGNDYRVHTWTNPTPEEWVDDIAIIMNRMSTDAPHGDLDIEEEPWDADRVRRRDEHRVQAKRRALIAAVEHIPSGRLIAYNGLTMSETAPTRPVHQAETLVLSEHRGHRLGTIVKIANIQHLARVNPDAPLIFTDNAEENRPMLDVNEAVGFEAIAYQAAWKKTFA
jgi:hypothetical protein